MTFLAQTEPQTGMPAWAWVVVSVVGAMFAGGGVWGWLKVLTSKRYGLIDTLLNQMASLQQQVGGLHVELERLKSVEKSQAERIRHVERAYRSLARDSMVEINRLRTSLNLPVLAHWPPQRQPAPTYGNVIVEAT